MDNLTIYFKKNGIITPTLKNINLKAKKGNFIGIAGKVGSGKSLLFTAILDEAPYYSGTLYKKGIVAYV
jgi:ATP-binding cassette subfamily C (CFTR/MRP) protein 4